MTGERTYEVEGMTCAHCERSVAEEISELRGVQDVRADHASGLVIVRGTALDERAVRDAIAEAGYSAR
jgi:copper chaperone CopZ